MTAPARRDKSEDADVRLSELVAAFSLATDLGLGQPMEHVLRTWLIAARLSERIGLDAREREALYYVATLGWVGCVAETPRCWQTSMTSVTGTG